MSCGKDEEVLSRVVEGDVEIVTVRKISHHNPIEDFETIEVRRVPIVKKVKVKATRKAKVNQEIFRDDLKRSN